MEPSWHQNRSNIDANCEKRFSEKSCSRCSGGSIFEILGVEVGGKNRLKNEVNMGRHLGIDFSSILMDFGRQVGRLVGLKNRWKIARNRLGCFHIALGTFQEAPERETMNFQWVFLGGAKRGADFRSLTR